MLSMNFILVTFLLGIGAVRASPFLASREGITSLTLSEIEFFSPYTYFASAAYCDPSVVQPWSCGVKCDNNAGFIPVASGGDGNGVQFWYVGFNKIRREVIVAHQGTEPSRLLAVLTDLNANFGSLDPSLFPGIPPDILVHSGFRNDQAQTASDILQNVQATMSKFGTKSVTLVGHSLGAALSLLDSIYLRLHLPPETTLQSVLYGLPRVGNQAFADYVDANLRNLTHINNLKDPIPIIPDKLLGYVHPIGEVHIRETGEWAACPGQDNPSVECIVGDEPTILEGNVPNHYGPYNGIEICCH